MSTKSSKEVIELQGQLIAVQDALEKAERALTSKGYRKQCDIAACNCGPQWNHGGYAEARLREVSDALPFENGKTVLDRLINVMDDLNKIKSDLASKRELLEKLINDREDLRRENKILNDNLTSVQAISTQQVEKIRELEGAFKAIGEFAQLADEIVKPAVKVSSCLQRVDTALSERHSAICERCTYLRLFFGTEPEARKRAEQSGWIFETVLLDAEKGGLKEIVHCQHCVIVLNSKAFAYP